MNQKNDVRKSVEKDPQTYAIIGAAMEVHKELGHGFLEAVYQEALAIEFTARNIPFQREVELPVVFKGITLNARYKADFICYNEVIVELKVLSETTGREKAQVINYLKASGFTRALLLNFGSVHLQYDRIVFNLRESASSAEKIYD